MLNQANLNTEYYKNKSRRYNKPKRIANLYKNPNLEDFKTPNVLRAESKPCFKCDAINIIDSTYNTAVILCPRNPNLFCVNME